MMKKSVIRKYRILCIMSGIIIGCIFPVFTNLFMVAKSDLCEMIFIIACVIAGALVGVMSFFLGKYTILKTLLRFNKSFSRMSNGDFTHTCKIESDDSIGSLVCNLNLMKDSLRDLISSINTKVIDIDDVAKYFNTELEKFVLQVEDVLESAEEVSCDMNYISQNTSDIKQIYRNINILIASIAEKAHEGYHISKDISQKANEEKNELEVSIKKTDEVLNKYGDNLNRALEEVKVVNEINELLGGVIQISSQTNMLALNASIEANRSEKNGRGFTVIAGEIRRLSEESKKYAERIKEVIDKVNFSVNDLVDNSRLLLQYMDTDVKSEYQIFKKIILDNDNNSMYIKEMVESFSEKSNDAVQYIQSTEKIIVNISNSSLNSAAKAASILEDVKKLTQSSNELEIKTSNLKENSQILKDETSKFKLIR